MTKTAAVSRELRCSQLTRLGACAEQRAAFRARFGRAVQVTEDVCVAHASVFDWTWAAEHLLGPDAWAAYKAVEADALAAYKAATADAWAAYEAAQARAFARAYISDAAP